MNKEDILKLQHMRSMILTRRYRCVAYKSQYILYTLII